MTDAEQDASDEASTEAPLWWKLLIRVLLLIVVLLAAALAASPLLSTAVYPGEIAVRQILVPPFAGYSRRTLRPALHWSVPGAAVVHRLPGGVRQTQLSGPEKTAFRVETNDGEEITLSAAVLYHLSHGERPDGAGPVTLLRRIGGSPDDWENHVQQQVGVALAEALRTLGSEQLVDARLRREKTELAASHARAELAQSGIALDRLLLSSIRYEPGAEEKLLHHAEGEQQREMEDARARLSALKSRLAAEDAAEKSAREAAAAVGVKQAQLVRVDGEAYARRRRAEADLLLNRAAAEVDRQRNGLLASLPGADVYLAVQAAGLLGQLKGGAVSGVNPFDMEQWLKLLGSPGAARKEAP